MQPSEELAYWNARFGGAGYHYGTAPNAFLARQAHLLRPGMRALCVADGEGRNSVWLAEQGLAVTAFDFSPLALEKAQRLARERGVAVDRRLGDIYAWDWDAQSYDLVVAIFIQFSPPEKRAQVFAGLARALAPGGYLLLQGYTPRQLAYGTGGPPHAENLYTEALLREAFGALEIVQLAEHDEALAEGERHRGMSALIDLVARRPAPG